MAFDEARCEVLVKKVLELRRLDLRLIAVEDSMPIVIVSRKKNRLALDFRKKPSGCLVLRDPLAGYHEDADHAHFVASCVSTKGVYSQAVGKLTGRDPKETGNDFSSGEATDVLCG